MRKLLWADCTAAALAGGVVLLLSGWLSRLYALPQAVVLLVGTINLLYASYSFSLAVRTKRPRALINVLVVANMTWALICLGLLFAFAESISSFGIVHLGGEAIFVGGLAALEWKWRDQPIESLGFVR